jgi:hypothetical protein
MPIGFASFLAGCLVAATNLQAPAGQQVVRPGMTRAAVEALLGEPFYGYTKFGDPLEPDTLSADYRTPRLSVNYERGVVAQVHPPYRPVIIASGGR